MDLCVKCGKEVQGDFTVSNELRDGVRFIGIGRTEDNDHIVCDFCNNTLHMACCTDWEGGCCDQCLREELGAELEESPF